MITLMHNSWLLDYTIDIYICNQCKLFTNFIKSFIALLRITSARVFLGWGTVLPILALENKQVRAQI